MQKLHYYVIKWSIWILLDTKNLNNVQKFQGKMSSCSKVMNKNVVRAIAFWLGNWIFVRLYCIHP